MAIRGYSLDIISQGIGFNASLIPAYAVNQIISSLPKVFEEHALSFVKVNNPKVERFESEKSRAPIVEEQSVRKEQISYLLAFIL